MPFLSVTRGMIIIDDCLHNPTEDDLRVLRELYKKRPCSLLEEIINHWSPVLHTEAQAP